MRLAVLTNYHLDQVGGAEEALDRLATAWQAAGQDVTVLASPRRRSGPSRRWRPEYPVVELASPWSTRFGLGRFVGPLLKLHGQRPLDVVLASDAYWPGHVARLFRERTGVPYCLYSHGSDVMHGSRFLKRATCRKRLEATIRDAAAIACISHYMQGRIEEIARPNGLVRVISNGWPDEWRDALPPTASAETGIEPTASLTGHYVFAMGRIVERKGFQVLVEAWALLRRRRPDLCDVGLVIAGDGPYRESLITLADSLHLAPKTKFKVGGICPGEVVFPGVVHGNAKRRLVDGAAVGVCPSIRHEPQGMVVLEMLCRGVPVVASRAGGLPDHIHPGQNGMLFTPGSAVELADCLESMLNWPGGRAAWAEQARKSVANLSWNQVAKAHLQLLAEGAALKRGAGPIARPHFWQRWRASVCSDQPSAEGRRRLDGNG